MNFLYPSSKSTFLLFLLLPFFIGAGIHLWLIVKPERTVDIALLHTLTGANSKTEHSLLAVELQAIGEINCQGGLLGKKINPIIRDFHDEEEEAARITQELLTTYHLSAFFGGGSAGARRAIESLLEKNNALLFYPLNDASQQSSTHIMFCNLTANQHLFPALEWGKQKFGAKVFLIGRDIPYCRTIHTLARAYAEQAGIEIVGEYFIPAGETASFPHLTASISQAAPDFILSSSTGLANIALTKSLTDGGTILPVMWLRFSFSHLADLSKKMLTNHFFVSGYAEPLSNPANNLFKKRLQQALGYSQALGSQEEAAYTALHLWAQAVREAKSFETPKVKQALNKLHLMTPAGEAIADPQNMHLWRPCYITAFNEKGMLEILWQSDGPIRPDLTNHSPFPAQEVHPATSQHQSAAPMRMHTITLSYLFIWIALVLATFIYFAARRSNTVRTLGLAIFSFLSHYAQVLAYGGLACLGIAILLCTFSFHRLIMHTQEQIAFTHLKQTAILTQKINAALARHHGNLSPAQLSEAIEQHVSLNIRALHITDANGKHIHTQTTFKSIQPCFLCSLVGKNCRTTMIEIPRWKLHTTYLMEYQDLPLPKMRSLLLLFVALLTVFLVVARRIYYSFIEATQASTNASFTTALLLLIGNIIMWLIVYQTPISESWMGYMVKDGNSCKQLIHHAQAIAENRHLHPPAISNVGFLLKNLDASMPNKAMIHAFVWQRSVKGVPMGFAFENAQQLMIEESIKKEGELEDSEMWRTGGTITSLDNHELYPFSLEHVAISLTAKSLNPPLVLLPELYLLQGMKKPWISTGLQTPGYVLEDSFISSAFHNDAALEEVSMGCSNTLTFNFILRQSLAGAFFSYILPLLVILFSIFGLLWIDPAYRFTSYSGVFFATVLLHRSYRTALNLTHVNYLECFFFFAYAALVLLMIATLFNITKPELYERYGKFIKQSFWPLQLVLWLLTTLYFFY